MKFTKDTNKIVYVAYDSKGFPLYVGMGSPLRIDEILRGKHNIFESIESNNLDREFDSVVIQGVYTKEDAQRVETELIQKYSSTIINLVQNPKSNVLSKNLMSSKAIPICKLLVEGKHKQREIAKMFGVTDQYVSGLKRSRYYKNMMKKVSE